MIGSEYLIGTLANTSYKSFTHLYKCTYPQVFKIMSPVVSTYTSTDGSDLLSFFRP